MATPREITKQEYEKISIRCTKASMKYARKANRQYENAYWFSGSFSPCSGEVRAMIWKGAKPRITYHLTTTPCDKYCSEKLPMATCLIHTHDDKFYTCRHKVGNCPWKAQATKKNRK